MSDFSNADQNLSHLSYLLALMRLPSTLIRLFALSESSAIQLYTINYIAFQKPPIARRRASITKISLQI